MSALSRSAKAGPASRPTARQRFRRRLLAWYRANGRDLPWRRTDDPYHILVSEVMLQQTQVDRVLPKYHEWLEKYPSLEALAVRADARRDADVAAARLQHPAAAAARDRPRIGRRTAASCLRSRRRCSRSRASAPTRPAPSAASRSGSARPSSTPTSRACCFASSSARGDVKAHAMRKQPVGDLGSAGAAQARVRLQPGADGLRRHGLRRAKAECDAAR